jgi:general secretion pathway protein K
MKRMRGAALVLVLWLIVLATALIGSFALSARVEALQGKVLIDGVGAYESARAGVEYALLRLEDMDPRSHWQPDGRPYAWQFHDSLLEVRIVDESGKVDLNLADAQLLTQLCRAVGIAPERAAQLAGAIVDWRDGDPLSQPGGGAEDPDYAAAGLPYGAKDAPFESLGELQQVLGVTPQDYERLLPNVTLYAGRAQPEMRFAQAAVLTAMGMDAELAQSQRMLPGVTGAPAVERGSGTYSIESRARLTNGRVAVLRTVVRLGQGPVPGSMYTALRWEETWAPR